jgi:hypothetical protein
MQVGNATALRDAAAADVPAGPAGGRDRPERHGAEMAGGRTAELTMITNSGNLLPVFNC